MPNCQKNAALQKLNEMIVVALDLADELKLHDVAVRLEQARLNLQGSLES